MIGTGRKQPFMKISATMLLLLAFSLVIPAGAQSRRSPSTGAKRSAGTAAEAVHLNNLGAAYMNQQQFARALNLFRRAVALNPKLEIAKINEGIALANLQKYGMAIKVLTSFTRKDQGNAHARYTLGLIYKYQSDSEKSLQAFETAAKLVPNDPDVFYFIGTAESELGQNEKAVAAFQHTLELNPFHASAEFGLARALQRLGDSEKARQHLARFQHMVQAKLSVPMSLTYGDQGALSLALTEISANQPSAVPIPVRFVDITGSSGLGSPDAPMTGAPSARHAFSERDGVEVHRRP